MRTDYLGHWLLKEEGAVRGYLRLEEDRLVEVCEGDPPPEAGKGLVIPSFVNAHTHLGDSVAYPAPRGTVEQLVAPPDGYKHSVLRSTSRQVKIEAMRTSLEVMTRTGTSSFVDFREEGLEGVQELREALMTDAPECIVLGRPTDSEVADSELRLLLRSCDGLGISAVSDWSGSLLGRLSTEVKTAGKILAMHASEVSREDIGGILDLKPDLLVHLNQATDDDLGQCAAESVPVVVCPRSNEFFGLKLDIPRMIRADLSVCLGSDNAMVSIPNMLDEVRAAWRLSLDKGGLAPCEALRLATYSGHKVLSGLRRITRNTADWTDLAVISVGGEDPLRSVVAESTAGDVVALVRGEKVRRTRVWPR